MLRVESQWCGLVCRSRLLGIGIQKRRTLKNQFCVCAIDYNTRSKCCEH
jgi:hypothetical protein